MIDNLSIAVHAFVSRVSMSFSVDETLLPRYENLSTSFREVPSNVEMSPAWLKHIYSVLSALTWKPVPAAARSKLYSSVSAWLGVFASIAMSLTQSASVIVFAGYLLLLSVTNINKRHKHLIVILYANYIFIIPVKFNVKNKVTFLFFLSLRLNFQNCL